MSSFFGIGKKADTFSLTVGYEGYAESEGDVSPDLKVRAARAPTRVPSPAAPIPKRRARFGSGPSFRRVHRPSLPLPLRFPSQTHTLCVEWESEDRPDDVLRRLRDGQEGAPLRHPRADGHPHSRRGRVPGRRRRRQRRRRRARPPPEHHHHAQTHRQRESPGLDVRLPWDPPQSRVVSHRRRGKRASARSGRRPRPRGRPVQRLRRPRRFLTPARSRVRDARGETMRPKPGRSNFVVETNSGTTTLPNVLYDALRGFRLECVRELALREGTARLLSDEDELGGLTRLDLSDGGL